MVLSQYVLYSVAGNCWMVLNVQLIPTPKASVQFYDLSFKNKRTKQTHRFLNQRLYCNLTITAASASGGSPAASWALTPWRESSPEFLFLAATGEIRDSAKNNAL